jgi:hypothetical protein
MPRDKENDQRPYSIKPNGILLIVSVRRVKMEGMLQGAGGAPEEMDDGRMMDLSTKLEKAECFARNENPGFPMSNLFIGDSTLGCKSDADEQLIIHVSFQEFVKVSLVHCKFNFLFQTTSYCHSG